MYEAMLKAHFYDANARMQKIATDALVSFAGGDLLKTFLLGVKRFTGYPPVNIKKLHRTVAAHLIEQNNYAL